MMTDVICIYGFVESVMKLLTFIVIKIIGQLRIFVPKDDEASYNIQVINFDSSYRVVTFVTSFTSLKQ